MEEKDLTCICCPLGCALHVTTAADGTMTVTGNNCPRGDAYARKELTNPTRIVTSTVRVAGRDKEVLSVKTASDIPKGKIMECMEAIKKVEAVLPVQIGNVILANVAGTGVDIIATKDMK